MSDKKGVSNKKPPANKWQYFRRNAFTILTVIFVGLMFLSPDAKSFVLRQLMATGLFNASMDKENTDTAPQTITDFHFADENGNIQNTSSLRGKVVFINFWASWCPPCRAEFPSVETLYTRFIDNPDVFFLTINEDNDLATGRMYLDKEKYSVPIYQSHGNVPVELYAGTLPTTIVLDKNGEIRYHHSGFANYGANEFIKQIEELANEQYNRY